MRFMSGLRDLLKYEILTIYINVTVLKALIKIGNNFYDSLLL